MSRVLYIQPGLVPPPRDKAADKLVHVPAPTCGDVLLPTWDKTEDEIRARLGESYPFHQVNQFTYHLYPAGAQRYGALLQKLAIFAFFIRKGLQLHRQHRYDCIMCYNWTLTGLAAVLLKWLIGAKLIVEIANVPEHAYVFNRFGETYASPKTDWVTRLVRRFISIILHAVVGSADRVKLLYPEQLGCFPRLQRIPATVIAPAVAVSRVPFTGKSGNTVLTVGAPWYVKGVDLLIRAFRQIESEFPEMLLRAVGYYPNAGVLHNLAAGSRQIEIMKALPNAETLQLIADSCVFVLASRTEGAGRVLMEAMAAGKPVIASRVGGIPHYVKDGVNGFLFEPGDAEDLAAKLRTLLRSQELREQFGSNGYRLARTQYDERTFGIEFGRMIEQTVNGT